MIILFPYPRHCYTCRSFTTVQCHKIPTYPETSKLVSVTELRKGHLRTSKGVPKHVRTAAKLFSVSTSAGSTGQMGSAAFHRICGVSLWQHLATKNVFSGSCLSVGKACRASLPALVAADWSSDVQTGSHPQQDLRDL